jgi:predicted  nucleic acid-binding Zn-ribbon protein
LACWLADGSEEPWEDGERALLLQSCAEHGAEKWEQRAYELKSAGYRYRDADEVEAAYGRFIVEERRKAALAARAAAAEEARRMKASAAEAKRLVEQAEALRLLEEGQRAYESMEWKRAHDALMPAAALAPDNEEIRDALALATVQYEAWLEASERQRRAREEEETRRRLAAELQASKLSHPMQWAVFQQIDTSGDGLLQTAEISAYMSELGQAEMARELVRALDVDGDGDIDFKEFCRGWERWIAANSVGANSGYSRHSAF